MSAMTLPNTQLLSITLNAFLGVTVDAKPETVLAALDHLAALQEATKLLKEQIEAGVVEWITANGELVRGDVRLYVGVAKTTKCVDPGKTLEALLTATGGDFTATVDCLSSGAWKHGACAKVLNPAVWGECFKTTSEEELREGKPKLQKVNTAFLPGGAR